MTATIHHIETLLPEFGYDQTFARDLMMSWLDDPKTRRLVRRLYDMSGIERRHSVLKDFLPGAEPELFGRDAGGRVVEPSTEERNRCFIRASRRLSVELARKTLAGAKEFAPSDITHVVTVSCTGFYNPGPDFDIVTQLGLSEQTERYHIGFMGCYAAFPALRMARQFCAANSEAVVLIVCLELCSLHLQIRNDPNSILANALFGDGAAAAIVSARPPSGCRPVLALRRFETAMATEGCRDMAWEIGDNGFNITLSAYIPDIIAANIGHVVDSVLSRAGLRPEQIARWAIHPGGKAILDKIEAELNLKSAQLDASREVLQRCGNMSSATILFVLHRMMEQAEANDAAKICAMAFGPGLTIESAILELLPATAPAARRKEAPEIRVLQSA